MTLQGSKYFVISHDFIFRHVTRLEKSLFFIFAKRVMELLLADITFFNRKIFRGLSSSLFRSHSHIGKSLKDIWFRVSSVVKKVCTVKCWEEREREREKEGKNDGKEKRPLQIPKAQKVLSQMGKSSNGLPRYGGQ